MNTTAHFLEAWTEARTRFSNLLTSLSDADLRKKLPGCPNSAGFLIRYNAEVELLFAKNVFGQKDIRITAKTVIAQKDTGDWTDWEALKEILDYAFTSLQAAILAQTEEDWGKVITTREFGTKTKAEAMGRILSHTAYHAGQLGMTLRYGVG